MEEWTWNGSTVQYQEKFVKHPDEAFKQIYREVSGLAKNESGVLFNKPYVTARKTVQFSDSNIRVYQYSGASAEQTYGWDMCPVIEQLRQQIKVQTGVLFNFCLVNIYPPEGYLSFHSDDENDMLPGSPIVSISLGQVRTFRFRPKLVQERQKDKEKKIPENGHKDYKLAHGSLLTMTDQCQKVLQHSITPSKKVQDIRINLTFRLMKPK